MSIFPALLTLHLIAFILMVGTTLIDFINYRTFWRLVNSQKEQAAGILAAAKNYSRLTGIGAALLIATGTGMAAPLHAFLGTQLWFKLKMILVLLLVINSIFIGRRLGVKLRKIFGTDSHDAIDQVLNLKYKLQTYYLVQLGFFLMIVLLTTYKFS
ncbi:hypothetical protein RYH73_20470 [Olivibacter sp. CPCC 100613]|uniref:hypothetical protein n=1 Tax=Olivibacter sp. CPCC 100613 TaxID=3079931 RepID=UPI002FFB5720